MEPQMQQEMTPEDAKAGLGLATRLSEQMLMMQAQQDGTTPMEVPQDAQNAPQQEMTPDMGKNTEMDIEKNMSEMEGKMDKKMETLRTELKDTIKTEIESLRDDIKSALDQENGEN